MLIFNKKKLYKIIKDFYELTGATISIFDTEFNRLLVYPPAEQKFCQKIKSGKCSKQGCFGSDKNACMKASTLNEPYMFTCHAGLLDVSIPVRYENEILAYIMFGQIRDCEQKYVKLDNVIKCCSNYDISPEIVEELYENLPILTHKQVTAAANFLAMSTVYLHVSQAIKIEKNELVSGIDSYITNNISSHYSISELCEEFKITQSRLYELSHKYFQMPIGNYITKKKMDKAKQLLTTTQMAISLVSENVGFTDYNYFIRKFKQETGYTPLQYRKNFPHNAM